MDRLVTLTPNGMSLAYMENVEKELDRLISKFKDFNKHGVQALCDLIPHIENYQRDLAVLTGKNFKLEFCTHFNMSPSSRQ